MGDEIWERRMSKVMEDLESHAEDLRFYPVKTSIKCLLCAVHYAEYLRTFYLCL